MQSWELSDCLCDQAIYAVMKTSRGSGRFGPKLLQKAILAFYKKYRLLPKGMTEEMSAVDLWSLKMGRALSRLVLCLNRVNAFHSNCPPHDPGHASNRPR